MAFSNEDGWDDINRKIDALASAVMRSDDPAEAGPYALAKLPRVMEFKADLLYGRYRIPDVDGRREASRQAILDDLWQGSDPA